MKIRVAHKSQEDEEVEDVVEEDGEAEDLVMGSIPRRAGERVVIMILLQKDREKVCIVDIQNAGIEIATQTLGMMTEDQTGERAEEMIEEIETVAVAEEIETVGGMIDAIEVDHLPKEDVIGSNLPASTRASLSPSYHIYNWRKISMDMAIKRDSFVYLHLSEIYVLHFVIIINNSCHNVAALCSTSSVSDFSSKDRVFR